MCPMPGSLITVVTHSTHTLRVTHFDTEHASTHKQMRAHTTPEKTHTRKCTHTIQSCRKSKRRSQSNKLLVAPNLTIQPTLYVHYILLHVHRFRINYIYIYIFIFMHIILAFEHLQSNQCTSIHAISKTGGMYKRAVSALVVSTFSLFTPTMEIWTFSMFWNSVETTN